MKKIFTLLLILFSLFSIKDVFAQAPQTMNYQGVARGNNGQPYANSNIAVRLKIHDFTPTGSILYSEIRSVTTNAFGLFNVLINSTGASAVTGNFNTINWNNGAKFLETEIDAAGGSNFTSIGTTQMQSVPYALLSDKATKLVVPYTESIASNDAVFNVTNSSSGRALEAKNTGAGGAGYFESKGTNTLWAVNNSNNAGNAAIVGTANGTGGIGVSGQASAASSTGVNAANFGGGLALNVWGALKIAGGNTSPGAGKVLTSDAQGNASWQAAPSAATNKVGFSVRGAAGGGLQNMETGQWNKYHGAIEEYDPGNDYTLYNQGSASNPSSSFTVPVSGFYHLEAGLHMSASTYNAYFESPAIRFQLKRNGVTTTLFTDDSRFTTNPDATNLYLHLSLNVPLTAGDQVWVEVKAFTDDDENYSLFYSPDATQNKSFSAFSGYLIFAN